MQDHVKCENPFCLREFTPRKKGRRQRFCSLPCRRQWKRLVFRLGTAAVQVYYPLICAEMKAAERRAGEKDERSPAQKIGNGWVSG